MTRTLDAALETTIASDATEPVDLLQIDFPAPDNTLYLSSWGDQTVDGDVYASGLEVRRVQFALGQFQCSFTVNCADGAFQTLLNTHTARGHDTRLYRYYAGHTKVLICQGVLDGGRWNLTRAALVFRLSSGNSGRLPRLAMVPPLVEHMPQAGEVINWGLGTFTFEVD